MAEQNAKYQLQKLRRELRDNKYIARKHSNPKNWLFYRALIWIFEERKSIQTRSKKLVENISDIAILARAEILSKKKLKSKLRFESHKYIEQFTFLGLRGDCARIGNDDWKLKLNKDCTKLKICELATGNKVTEEWNFLPKSWKTALDTTRTIFDKNFVFLEFEYYDDDMEGDILILNLSTRKQFWLDSRGVKDEIGEKIPDAFDDGEPFVINEFTLSCADKIFYRMKVRSNEIQMEHQIIFNNGQLYGVFLDSHLVFKLDDEKEIMDFEVVNVKINEGDSDSNSSAERSDSDAEECVYFGTRHEELTWIF